MLKIAPVNLKFIVPSTTVESDVKRIAVSETTILIGNISETVPLKLKRQPIKTKNNTIVPNLPNELIGLICESVSDKYIH